MKDRTRDEAEATISKMAGRQEEDLVAQLLPDDVLANILSRLAPRSLAVSRCVCPAWRALIDGRRLLRADLLLPRSLAGLFINCNHLLSTELFSRPAASAAEPITYQLPPLTFVRDHCNGLLLLYTTVLNPGAARAIAAGRPASSGRDGVFLSDHVPRP